MTFQEKFAKAIETADVVFAGKRNDDIACVLLLMIFESLEDSRDQLYRIEQELIQIRGNQR